MAHTVRGVIARSRGAAVEVVSAHVPDPGSGEALVRVVACGVCHTDVHYREGGIGDDFPYLSATRRRPEWSPWALACTTCPPARPW
jgi:S-(hydroxymethyl)mycothiol dehydrogenase